MDFYFYLIQILLSLKHAYEIIDFTHYDLHTQNIIMYKQSDESFYLKYSSPDGDIYCYSDKYIPKFIDYGFSHIKYENKHYGAIDPMPYYSVFNDRSFILGDFYKLIYDSIDHIWVNENKFKLIEIIIITNYFTKKEIIIYDDFQKICNDITRQNGYFFILPYSPLTSDISENKWKYFKNKYDLDAEYNPVTDGCINYINKICIKKFGQSPIVNFNDLDPNITIL